MLIERVREVDEGAALWLLEFYDEPWMQDKDQLAALFVWKDTDPGQEYWSELRDKLEGKHR